MYKFHFKKITKIVSKDKNFLNEYNFFVKKYEIYYFCFMKKVAFIINPHSFKGQYEFLLKNIENQEIESLVLVSKSKEDTENFIKKNWENVDIFVAAGGDGTISSVARHLIFSDKILGVFPMGSGNGFAMENHFDKNFSHLLSKIKRKEYKIIDSVDINGFFGINVAGVGLDSKIAFDFEKTSRGFLNYMKTSILNFLSFKPINVVFTDEKYQLFNGEYQMLNVANTRQFGNRAYIAPQAKLDDGKLEIVLVKKIKWFSSLNFVFDLFLKKMQKNSNVKYISVEEVEVGIDFDLWHIDGDVVEMKSPVRIKNLHQSLRVLC